MKKLRISVILLSVMAISNIDAVFAELTPQQIVDQFNSLSGPNGWSFTSGIYTERYFASANAAFTPDLSAYYAYAHGTLANSFRTFCVEPNSPSIASSGTAKLNFTDGNSTRVSIDNKAVSIGTAFLYKQFATASFAPSLYDYTNASQRSSDYSSLLTTLRALMSPQGSLDWTTNKYLRYLLSLNDSREYWTSIYNPGDRYTEIGDYAIFVMNISNSSGTGEYQDFLYIAKAQYPNNGVPEPATLLLWTLGAGTLGFGYRRRRRDKTDLV